MKKIKLLMAITFAGLLGVSSFGYASTYNPVPHSSSYVGEPIYFGDIILDANDPIEFSGSFAVDNFPSDSSTLTEHYWNLLINPGGVDTFGNIDVILHPDDPPSMGNVLVQIFTALTLDGGTGLYYFDDANRVGMMDDNLFAFALAAGTNYYLSFTGEENNGYSGTITTTPVPAAGLLFASALLGAGALGRRKKKTKTDAVVDAFARAS